MWEKEDVGRIGVEWYYTGCSGSKRTRIADASEPYVIVGLLGERQFGRCALFVNGENLTGVRQTKWDPLVRPSPRRRRPLDGRRVGAARRPQHQRRR